MSSSPITWKYACSHGIRRAPPTLGLERRGVNNGQPVNNYVGSAHREIFVDANRDHFAREGVPALHSRKSGSEWSG